MNPIWQNFLNSHPISSIPSPNALYPIAHLSVIKVTGDDAVQFLQGQLTCNIKELNSENSFFAGFCNAKGRVISTLLILKHNADFLLILPTVLSEKVLKKLKMYVLRAKVQLTETSDEFCLSGVQCSSEIAAQMSLPEIHFFRKNNLLRLSNQHYLHLASAEEAIALWTDYLQNGFTIQAAQQGQLLDITAGLAWLDATSSEEYIPQMLNLDKLGGISFNKGCYTGQEVVARTHYLGKSKRELFVAQAAVEAEIAQDTEIVDETAQAVGQIIAYQRDQNDIKILVVLQISAIEAAELRLNNLKNDKISLVSFSIF